MVYKNFTKPSKNMNLSMHEIYKMQHEQENDLYIDDDEKDLVEGNNNARERDEYINNITENFNNHNKNIINRNKMLENVKKGLLAECFMKLYKASSLLPLTESDTVVVKNIINKFINERCGELINDFSTKNYILSEFSRITTKYYNKVLESSEECKEINPTEQLNNVCVDQDVLNGFYKELEDVDIDDAGKMIKDRVSDSISEFIDTNIENKLEYEDIIKAAQDKMATSNGDQELVEAYSMQARRNINERKLKKRNNVFGFMVESLTKSAFKDENLKTRYFNEASINMESVVHSVQLLYTMLEMVNTTNMVNVDDKFINWYLTNLA